MGVAAGASSVQLPTNQFIAAKTWCACRQHACPPSHPCLHRQAGQHLSHDVLWQGSSTYAPRCVYVCQCHGVSMCGHQVLCGRQEGSWQICVFVNRSCFRQRRCMSGLVQVCMDWQSNSAGSDSLVLPSRTRWVLPQAPVLWAVPSVGWCQLVALHDHLPLAHGADEWLQPTWRRQQTMSC